MLANIEELRTRDKWLAARRQFLGSSDAPVLWGYGYESQSLVALWAEKVHGTSVEWSKSDLRRLALGKAAEPIIREWFAEEIGHAVFFDGENTIRRNPAFPHLSASLDGWLESEEYGFCPVELKKIGRHNSDEWWDELGNPVAPLRYQVQLGHQMIVTGATHGYLVGLIGDDDLEWRLVELPQSFLDQHLERCEAFWGYVERREMPPVDGSSATTDALQRLFPRENATEIADLPEEADSWSEEIEHLSKAAKEIEQRIDTRKNSLRAALGTAVEGITPAGVRWTYRTVERAGHTVAPSSWRQLRRAGSGRRKK